MVGLSLVAMIVAWVIYAAVTGRNLKQRLTDPEPIVTTPEAPATPT
jgi:hypothetical protein